MSNTTRIYRFEIRCKDILVALEESEKSATEKAFDYAEATGRLVTIITNDGPYPVYARVGGGCIQLMK